jgi:glycerate 2-kinase
MADGYSGSALAELRARAIGLFNQGVAASDPEAAVISTLQSRADLISASRRVVLIAFGKASCAMARAALPFVRDKLLRACVVTNRENATKVEGAEVVIGGHPLPDEGSLAGADLITEVASSAKQGDLVLLLISGGGSALVCAPALGISLADKIALNNGLVHCGADIAEINAARQVFSTLKGGGLADLTAGISTLSLMLSDVPGDDIRVIASGPTARPSTSASDALFVLQRHNLLATLPKPLRKHLADLAVAKDRARKSFEHVENVIIGSNRISLQRMISGAEELYPVVMKAADWLGGDVAVAAAALHRFAQHAAGQECSVAILAGGETTVKVRGRGKGGRNQELALHFALLNERSPISRPWVFLSGGTDGRDGPTNVAGGLVDHGSAKRMRAQGCRPEACLDDNDSYSALSSSGDLFSTGATGTNVADLQIILIL